MHRAPLVAAVVLGTAIAGPTPAAAAATIEVEGIRCRYSGLTDPAGPDDRQLAQVDGGPVAVTVDGRPATSVTLTCTLQVGGWTHDAADTASVSGSGPGVATVPPSVVSYDAAADQDVVLCSSLRVDTSTGSTSLYWDGADDTWSSDPSVVCYELGPAEPWPPMAGEVVDPVLYAADGAVCPALAVAYPPEGDVPGIWDCPPYGS